MGRPRGVRAGPRRRQAGSGRGFWLWVARDRRSDDV